MCLCYVCFSMPVLCICAYMYVPVHVCVVYILLYEYLSLCDTVCVSVSVKCVCLSMYSVCRVCWLIFASLTPTGTYFV